MLDRGRAWFMLPRRRTHARDMWLGSDPNRAHTQIFSDFKQRKRWKRAIISRRWSTAGERARGKAGLSRVAGWSFGLGTVPRRQPFEPVQSNDPQKLARSFRYSQSWSLPTRCFFQIECAVPEQPKKKKQIQEHDGKQTNTKIVS